MEAGRHRRSDAARDEERRGPHDQPRRRRRCRGRLLRPRLVRRWRAWLRLAITTHVAPSDLYRRLAFAGARDGWYGNPGGNFRVGLLGGLSFGRYDLVLRVGQLRDAGLEKPMLPWYGTLTFGIRW